MDKCNKTNRAIHRIAANPIIYRLVPSRFRFEIRQYSLNAGFS